MLDLTLTLGDVVTAGAFVVTGLLAAGGLKGKLREHDTALVAINRELEKLATGMTELVRFSGRLDRMDDRAIMQGARIDAAQAEVSEMRKDFLKHIMETRDGAKRPGQGS